MRVDDTDTLSYLRHLVGEQRINRREREIIRKALELNEPPPDFDATFGNPDIRRYPQKLWIGIGLGAGAEPG